MLKRCVFALAVIILVFSCVPAYAFIINGTERAVECHPVTLGGTEYIPLLFVCDAYGVSYSWLPIANTVKLYKKGSLLTLVLNETMYDSNGTLASLQIEPLLFNGAVMVPKSILQLPWWLRGEPGLAPPVIRKEFIIDKVIIDPGHGGKDPGGIGTSGLKEKNLVLDVALRLKKRLEKEGMSVLLTRDRDYFVSLADRARMVNASDADLFISVHANAHWSAQAEGFEVFHLSDAMNDYDRNMQMIENTVLEFEENIDFPNKNSDDATLWDMILAENQRESYALARAINCSVKTDNISCDRGVKSAQFFVLKWVDKPAVLIELGFVTSAHEARKLQQDYYKNSLVKAIVRGVLAFKAEYESTQGFTR